MVIYMCMHRLLWAHKVLTNSNFYVVIVFKVSKTENIRLFMPAGTKDSVAAFMNIIQALHGVQTHYQGPDEL